MRQLSDAYRDAIASNNAEPVFVAKINNSEGTIYLTTREITITDIGATFIHGSITAANFSSQRIEPENGYSTIGGMTITVDDINQSFTTALNAIEAADASLLNDKVELYVGDARIDFTEYTLVTPLYVSQLGNDELTYTLRLEDIQRITKKTLFADLYVTELVGNYGYSDASTVEVISPAGFPLVQHGADWAEDANRTIGYAEIDGVSQDGREVKEVISFTGKTATTLTGVKRARFGTERVDLSAEDSSGNPQTVELKEFVYIDLVQPAMLIALLTGDLYGQVGQTLPDNWHAGVDASLINLTSIENIGGDLWREHVEFRGLDSDNAKEFINEQVLAPYGVFMRIDQFGQYELARYGFLSQFDAPNASLVGDDLLSTGKPNRTAKNIENVFQINWEWRIDSGGFYARKDFYIDANSQSKYKVQSPIKEINLRGLRNRDKTSKPSLDLVAQSQVKRLSNPHVKLNVTAFLDSVIGVEVGDSVNVELPNTPDYETLDTYNATFEVRGIQYDFMSGTATLSLFASTGTPSQFVVTNGSNVVDIDTTGYTDLSAETYGSIVGGVFQFAAGTVPSGKYYFNGDVEFPAGVTVTGGDTFILDCDNLEFGANSKLDLKGKSPAGNTDGYFGIRTGAQPGLYTFDPGPFSRSRIYQRGNASDQGQGNSSVLLPDVARIANGDSITDIIPPVIYGKGGKAGGNSNITHQSRNAFVGVNGETGGAAVGGGGGVFISCDAIQYASSAIIDVSGADGNQPDAYKTQVNSGGDLIDTWFHAGASSFGWPGVCVVALKDKDAPKPFLYDLVVAKCGLYNERPDLAGTGSKTRRTSVGSKDPDKIKQTTYSNYRAAYPNTLNSFSGLDFASAEKNQATHVINLVVADDYVPEAGVDTVGSAESVTLNTNILVNVPRTPLGNQVTIECTATPSVGDANFKYVLFQYRLKGQVQWVPIAYDITTESTFTVTGTGDTYEILATSYNSAAKAGGSTIAEVTVPLIERDTETSDGGQADAPVDIKVPNIRGLELVNRITDSDWDKFKSPNAEFRWLKMSNTFGGTVDQVNGAVDLHLEGYKVRVSKADGTILREELVKDSSYVYTFDKNKKDTNGSPVRSFRVEVQAVATTGYSSEFVGFVVENPAPAAPSNVNVLAGFTSLLVSFDLPTDVDFVGVDFYLLEGASGDVYANGTVQRVANNVFNPEQLKIGTTYQLGAVSVDQFGTGNQITQIGVSTSKVISGELELEDTAGRLITNNSGYVGIMGVTDLPDVTNPVVFAAYDSITENTVFYVDVNGEMKLNFLNALAAIAVGGAVFGSAGCQIENNNGDPRFYIGSGTTESGITYESESLSVGEDVDLIGVNTYNDQSFYKEISSFEISSSLTTIGGLVITTGAPTIIRSTSGTQVASVEIDPSYGFSGLSWGEKIKFKTFLAFTLGSDAGGAEARIGIFSGTGINTQAVRILARRTGANTIDIYLAIFDGGSETLTFIETLPTSSGSSTSPSLFEAVYDPDLDTVQLYRDNTLKGSATASFAVDSGLESMLEIRMTKNSSTVDPIISIGDHRVLGAA